VNILTPERRWNRLHSTISPKRLDFESFPLGHDVFCHVLWNTTILLINQRRSLQLLVECWAVLTSLLFVDKMVVLGRRCLFKLLKILGSERFLLILRIEGLRVVVSLVYERLIGLELGH
jgi:hypothetical protein